MRKFSKTLLSLLLVVMMLAGGFPFANFVTKVEAVSRPTYRYKYVTTTTPGKQYLIVSGASAGAKNIVQIPNGTAEGGEASHVSQTVVSSGGNFYINSFTGVENCEFTLMDGMPASVNNSKAWASRTFMFQNVATGGYLYNKAYFDGGSTGRVKVTYDPLSDETNNPSSRVIFVANQTGRDTYVNMDTRNYTTVTKTANWVQFDATNVNQMPSIVINLPDGISHNSFNYLNLVYHPNYPNGTNINAASAIYLGSDGTHGVYSSQFAWFTGSDNWMLKSGSLDTMGGDFGYAGWGGTAWANYGTIQSIRLNYVRENHKNGAGAWYSSIIWYKNAVSAAVNGVTMKYRSWYGNDGFYPSHRYLLCQFCSQDGSQNTIRTNSSGKADLWLSNSGVVENVNGAASAIAHNTANGYTPNHQFYYGFNYAGNLVWRYSSITTSNYETDLTSFYNRIYFYEKELVTNGSDDCNWSLVTDGLQASDNGQEFIICNAGGAASNSAAIICSTGSGINEASGKTVTATSYTSTVNSGDTWRFLKVGNYYYIQSAPTFNNNTNSNGIAGQILIGDASDNGGANTVAPIGAEGGAYTHGWKYVWTYDATNHVLTGWTVNFNAGESRASKNLVIHSISNVYLYRKNYCSSNHSNYSSETLSAANCVDTGARRNTCTECGYQWTETIPVNSSNHKGPTQDIPRVEATCTTAGHTAGTKCGACGATLSGNTTIPIDSTAHNYGGWTKEDDTNHIRRCTYNNSHVDRAAHSWDGGVVTKSATCTETGIRTYTCDVCHGTKTETIAKLAHTPGDWETTQAATCTATGTKVKKCTVCHTVLETDTIPALNHDYSVLVETVSADCTNGGYKVYKCSRCNATETRDQTPALGHNYVATVTASTCTEAGYTTHTCSRCGDSYTDSPTGALGHDMGSWTETTPPTCTEAGEERRDCSRCDYFETREKAALGHNFVAGTPVQATCTTDGYTPYTCSRCGATENRDTVQALGHDMETIEAVAATCIATGNNAYYHCERCGKYFTDAAGTTETTPAAQETTIDPSNHSDLTHTAAVPATCIANGNIEYWYCTACHKYYRNAAGTDEILDGLAGTVTSGREHVLPENWTEVRTASGLSTGIKRKECSRCDYYIEMVDGAAEGFGYSTKNSTDALTYRYQLVNSISAGHEYLIVNSNTTGGAKALYDNNGAKGSGDVTVSSDNGTPIITSVPSDAYVWNTFSGIYLQNKGTGDYLKAYNNTNAGNNISLNLDIAATYENTNDYKFSSDTTNGLSSASGYYLGYKDVIPGSSGNTGVFADPDGKMQLINKYLYSGPDIIISSGYTLEFDVCFMRSDVKGWLARHIPASGGGWHNHDVFEIGPTSSRIQIGEGSGWITSANYDFDFAANSENPHSYGNHWQHFKIVYDSGTHLLNMYVDGQHVITDASAPNFNATTGILSLPSTDVGDVYIDNFHIEDSSGHSYDYDFDDDDLFDGDGNEPDPVDIPANPTTNAPTPTNLATDVFTASTSSSAAPRVYFYEKTEVDNASTVYQRASEITSGDSYMLVDKRLEDKSAHELTGSGTASATMEVYSDGVSYVPYVTETENNKFIVTSVDGAYVFYNPTTHNYLTTSGTVTQTYSSDCRLPVTTTTVDTAGAESTIVSVSVGDAKYFLYKKTAITEIDTDLVTDFAVIDFGRGFEVDINKIRGNDDWTDRVGITLNGIFDSIGSIDPNDTFYKTEQATYVSQISHTNKGTYTYDSNNHKITFEPAPNAKYEDVDTIYYGVTIDRLGAHMYAPLNIIPATMVYYEDTAIGDGGVVQYTNSSLATTGGDHDGWGKWSTVRDSNTINNLFDDMEANGTYGYNSKYNDCYLYSAGSAKMVRLGAENMDMTEACSPTVSFTFKGTGFAVYSATGNTTDIIFVEVIDTATDDVVVNDMVDNYYGYEYKNDKWTPVSTGSTDPAMYQIPVLDYNNLSNGYSEYSVTIFISHSSWFDHDGAGYTDFYFDGFRVYNPLGTDVATNYPTAAAAYQKDKEYAPKFINLRENLEGDGSATGVKYLDSKVASSPKRGTDIVSTSYEDGLGDGVGAKNDIMLTGNAAITFALTSNSVPSKIALGAKVSQGTTPGTLTITGAGGTKTITVSSGTDMFYDITGVVGWTSGTTSGTIMITKGNGDVVSLTDIKISYANASLPQTVTFAAPNMRTAWEELADIYGVEVIEGDVAGDGAINLKDLKLIKQYLAGKADLSKYDIQAADVDGNGLVNFADLKLLKARIAA